MKMSEQFNKIISYLRRPQNTAQCAKERLQIIIAHERKENAKPEYFQALQQDILNVIAKYIEIKKDEVKIELERQDGCSILELNIVLPTSQNAAKR